MFKFLLLLIITVTLYGGCPIRTTIPANSEKYTPLVYKESLKLLPRVPPYYFSALIEQETCVQLCGNSYWARRCWNPKVELKTKREQGVGLGQLTRAWNRRGQLRFDSLYAIKVKHPKLLREVSWNNIKSRPDLQIKSLILLWGDNLRYLSNKIPETDLIAFTDSSYNGGFKYLNIERSICKLRKNCNPDLWFGNVAITKSGRARKKLYGKRTAWDINRNHVNNVINLRLNKYKKEYLNKIKNKMCYIIRLH